MSDMIKANNAVSAMALATALFETARDAAFNAVVGAAMARIATAHKWNVASEEKPMSLKAVDEAMRDMFFAKNKTSNAYRWVSLAIKVSKKLAKDMTPTLDFAKACADSETALSMIVAALRVAGADNLDNLELWSEGIAKPAKDAASEDEKLAKFIENKGESLTDAGIDAAIEALSQLRHARVNALLVANNAKELAETAREEMAAA